jgi:microcompartment protein CcmL/EutN
VTRPAPAADTAPASGALGLLEARGYAIQVEACDRMAKAAAVRVSEVLTVHNRVVCALVVGPVAAVQEALAVGRAAMADYEHLLAAHVIAQPAAGLVAAFAGAPAGAGV